ncbi:hypothetical protein ES332_D13G200200v1 [Gossypium tomentosum]|uniref:Uncharacterized protein n=1 Tax=Gossypium tomentosum TaxID=34277 RepID=A0A5D2HZ25_GOSTO|nr:hypothetical protein ES332_D13G200200v1 [Gossypium tomentosum]
MTTERRPGSLHQAYGEVDVEARVDLAGTEGHVRAETHAGGQLKGVVHARAEPGCGAGGLLLGFPQSLWVLGSESSLSLGTRLRFGPFGFSIGSD